MVSKACDAISGNSKRLGCRTGGSLRGLATQRPNPARGARVAYFSICFRLFDARLERDDFLNKSRLRPPVGRRWPAVSPPAGEGIPGAESPSRLAREAAGEASRARGSRGVEHNFIMPRRLTPVWTARMRSSGGPFVAGNSIFSEPARPARADPRTFVSARAISAGSTPKNATLVALRRPAAIAVPVSLLNFQICLVTNRRAGAASGRWLRCRQRFPRCFQPDSGREPLAGQHARSAPIEGREGRGHCKDNPAWATAKRAEPVSGP